MAFDYAKSAATSLKLLTKFGRDVVKRSFGTGTYNPATGANVAKTIDTTWKGVLLDFGAGQALKSGGLIKATDKRLLLESGAAPSLADKIVAGGVEYTIVTLGEVNPAGTVVLFDIHLTR